jgi:hypothetical protein
MGENLVVLGGIALAKIPAHAAGTGADNDEVAGRAGIAVGGARGQHEDDASPDLDRSSAWASENDGAGATDDAEDLVRSGVEAMEGEDSVHPRAKPAVAREQLPTLVRRADGIDLAVDEHRQSRVRNVPGLAEGERLGRHHRATADGSAVGTPPSVRAQSGLGCLAVDLTELLERAMMQ